LTAKKIAQDFKNFIKTNNSDYSEKLKKFLNEGFQNYYDEINKKLQDEYMTQESKQNNIQQAIDNTCKEIENLHLKVKIILKFQFRIITFDNKLCYNLN